MNKRSPSEYKGEIAKCFQIMAISLAFFSVWLMSFFSLPRSIFYYISDQDQIHRAQFVV